MRDPKKPTTPKRPRKPGKKIKPENSPKPLLEPGGKPKPRPETRPQPETRPKPKPEVKPDVRPGLIKPGSKPKPKPDTKPETRPEPKPKPELDTKPLANDIKPGKPGARQPLLLMPMRLEYRIVDSKVPPTVVHPSDLSGAMMDLRRKFSQTKPSDRKALQALEQERVALNQKYKAVTPRLGPARLRSRTELWLRWYPDDNFAEAGTAPPSETETDALEAFLAHPLARYWPKLDDGTLLALWGELVAVAGPARAVHLFRQHDSEEKTRDWEARIGRITGLPKQIGVFALHKGEIVLLGEGAPIPQNDDTAGLVSYAPDVLGDGAWMSDFDAAIDLGMGMKLADDKMVDLALEADWLICTGISDKDGRDDFSRLIQDRRNAGAFEILGQDTATNNAPGVSAGRDPGDTVQERLWDHTELELGVLQQDGLDADLLAEALDIDANELKKAPGASESGHLDAAAMIRAIGPALMDGSLDATNQLNDVDDPDFIELLAQHVQARGILPAIKVGSGAYGVLPVLGTSGLQIVGDTLNATEADYSRFVHNYANGVLTLLTERSDSATLRLEPDDPDASEKLTDILQTSRVSRRIDVSNMGASDIKGLDCPYVEGEEDNHKPAAYFLALERKRLRLLDDPDEGNTKWPLLYRLALLSLRRYREIELLKGTSGFTTRGDLRHIQGNWIAGLQSSQRQAISQARNYAVNRFSTASPTALNRIPPGRIPHLQIINKRYQDAILRLRAIGAQTNGTARLEILMMEVIDLFQHRLDAWITGLASIKLTHQRRKEKIGGLALGYYGFLGKLRRSSATGESDGYIQAASQGQAVSAAILRSAYLRNRGDGAFQIDLSSVRTSRALKLMDHIRRGVPLPECLGLRGERWLRNDLKSREIFALRDAYPLENVDSDGQGKSGPAGSRCFDGLKLVEADRAKLASKHRGVQAVLRDDLDALSDVVVAEAVHQRAGGSADVAAAWLRVLSGGPIPHRPEFLRTHRSGHASDYRVTLLLPQTPPTKNGTPLRMASGGLASLFDERFPQLSKQEVHMTLHLNDETLYEATLTPEKHLGLDAISIAKLGPDTLRKRLVSFAVSDLNSRLSVHDFYKLPTHADRVALEAAGLHVDLNWDGLRQMTEDAAGLWALVHRAEPMSAGDLSNAADPVQMLDETRHVAALQGAAEDMWERAGNLLTYLKQQQKTYYTLIRKMFQQIDALYEKPGLPWGENYRNDTRLRAQVIKLHGALRALQKLDIDGAGKHYAASRLVETMVDSEAEFRAIDSTLRSRIAALQSALKTQNTDVVALSDARADLKSAMEAVRTATGVSALALCPVFAKTPDLAPLLQSAQTASNALGPWPRYRAKLSQLLDHVGVTHKGYPVQPGATADDKDAPDADVRDETLAPRAYHRGIFMARGSDIDGTTLSGLVIDEWVETRPSTQQDAAIALNYDSPQAEAPNSLLLCIAETGPRIPWSSTAAAGHVQSMLDLMKARALSTQTTPLSENVLPLANRVSHIGNGNNERPRIPQAAYKVKQAAWFAPPGQLTTVSASDLQKSPLRLNQIGPFRARPRTNQ